ncbi:ATP/GTP-binding protein [Streptomyces thermoviolaceus subsp. thermoviolaceus]|uniref:ATP/GTP-binding protein n=1 Tax=Streptomyces thermoviolaceus subsp. thermoviolaceus TaxID=66860 RepID=A0ABX0YSH4_STRTL|nr:hypothetical protein [Streptomyces thermoviolaceus]NJP15418.1 hypothetical protein [Streptomyces thermoviolaceus subsp. thermoviolaceus]GHB04671.1 ATP/GTP-binding protein [Streptomyces thermoviolaceus subsp. thermoviolaceus]
MAEGTRIRSDDGMGRRIKRFQDRYEPMVTRLVLLGIFASGLLGQFVKPVGDALEGKVFVGGALLSLVAYVLYDQVRELTSSVRPAARALVSSTEIGMFVREALQARRVEIAFLGYTGETLYNALYHRLEDLFDNPGPTRRVSIRMLVPDFGMPMTVPSRVGSDGRPVDDPDFRKRLERRCREYDHVLSGLAERLTENSRVTVECSYRLYPGIPRDKICIFNRQQVLHGLYDLSARMRLEHAGPEYYDPKGFRTDLSVWSRKGTAAAEAAVSIWSKHFDDLWNLAVLPPWRQGVGG